MMGEDIRFLSEVSRGKRCVCLGKAAIFCARNCYLTRGTLLMIHQRRIEKKLMGRSLANKIYPDAGRESR